MFEDINEAVAYWKEELSYVKDANVVSYEGGYPVVEFIIDEACWSLVKDKKKHKRIIRSAEMEGGIEVGVSMCFIGTARIDWAPPKLTVCGYPEVINRILKKLM